MASRGRGRGGRGGWGRGAGVYTYAPPAEFKNFPADVNLPGKLDLNDDYMKKLLSWSSKFQRYWKASPYLLEDKTSKGESRNMHIERYSDRKRTRFTRDSLSQVLMLDNFPQELTKGTTARSRKKFQWNPESNFEKKLDLFEQKERKSEGREDKDEEEEKKDGEEDENEENQSDEDPSDDDYAQNVDFDDDEDDYNDVEEDEAIF